MKTNKQILIIIGVGIALIVIAIAIWYSFFRNNNTEEDNNNNSNANTNTNANNSSGNSSIFNNINLKYGLNYNAWLPDKNVYSKLPQGTAVACAGKHQKDRHIYFYQLAMNKLFKANLKLDGENGTNTGEAINKYVKKDIQAYDDILKAKYPNATADIRGIYDQWFNSIVELK